MIIDNTSKVVTPFSYNFYNKDWKTLDAFYGPWNSFKEVIDKITTTDYPEKAVDNFLKTKIPVGLTIALYENDKVVEYWNPVAGQGFVKKTNGASVTTVSTYNEALALATDDNIGNIIYVNDNNSDSEDETNVYIVAGSGELKEIGGDSLKLDEIIRQISEINNVIDDDEESTAQALNDLNDRIDNISHPITGIADNSEELLNIDDDSKLEAKIGDLSIRQVA